MSVCVCVIVQVHAGNGQTGVLLLILSRQSALEGTIIHFLIMGDKPVKQLIFVLIPGGKCETVGSKYPIKIKVKLSSAELGN